MREQLHFQTSWESNLMISISFIQEDSIYVGAHISNDLCGRDLTHLP